ncbi:glutamate racemase [Geomonas sp. Red69]|uniref:Glutamate racemase n=1 Tax=Geomonas diazotrophica TaxID=2843197 RepID=A0ABX8JH39_9BACT|nr:MULTISPECIES: glutamate racemase [Geomonas]MBU5635238.1 glutamate racemase [Geomonas diazotrophica]QWV97705.1 glutamate racemase [Geomonas nitrogeniifigens]QXE86841.1 glutamate racemase [Geomonas nitrogeniifigens]
MAWKAIGIFDSGVGGLTVLKEVLQTLPQEDTIYLGDTARVPYGTKSPETVIRYSRQIARYLMNRDIKLLVVACNTASAVALSALQQEFDIPIVGVIEPGARAAAAATRTGKVGVIGTAATVASSAYTKAIKRINPDIEVVNRACPLFVPLAEEGWVDNEVTRMTARIYLEDLKAQGVDTLVLGCTHYPILKEVIAQVMGPEVTLVDSAAETARTVAQILTEEGLLRPVNERGNHHYYVTDIPAGFIRVGNRFLGGELGDVYQVSLEQDLQEGGDGEETE